MRLYWFGLLTTATAYAWQPSLGFHNRSSNARGTCCSSLRGKPREPRQAVAANPGAGTKVNPASCATSPPPTQVLRLKNRA